MADTRGAVQTVQSNYVLILTKLNCGLLRGRGIVTHLPRLPKGHFLLEQTLIEKSVYNADFLGRGLFLPPPRLEDEWNGLSTSLTHPTSGLMPYRLCKYQESRLIKNLDGDSMSAHKVYEFSLTFSFFYQKLGTSPRILYFNFGLSISAYLEWIYMKVPLEVAFFFLSLIQCQTMSLIILQVLNSIKKKSSTYKLVTLCYFFSYSLKWNLFNIEITFFFFLSPRTLIVLSRVIFPYMKLKLRTSV